MIQVTEKLENLAYFSEKEGGGDWGREQAVVGSWVHDKWRGGVRIFLLGRGKLGYGERTGYILARTGANTPVVRSTTAGMYVLCLLPRWGQAGRM
jgi:hypothetical protein